MCNFFQSYTNSVVPISIFLKSCTMIKKLYSQREKLYGFGTLCFGLKFISNGNSTKMYNFFQSYTTSVVPISIFLKSCTTIEKSYTALIHCSAGLKFICSGISTKMYNFFQSCTNYFVIISIFLKTCKMVKNSVQLKEKGVMFRNIVVLSEIHLYYYFHKNVQLVQKLYKLCRQNINIFKNLYNQRKKLYSFGTLWLVLNSFAMVFLPKCTTSPKLYILCRPLINIFKNLYKQSKSSTSLVHCAFVSNSFVTVFARKYKIFPRLYKFCHPHINIFKKLYNQRKQFYSFGTLWFGLKFICNGICTKMYNFSQSCTNYFVPISIFLKSYRSVKNAVQLKEKAVRLWNIVVLSKIHL